MKLFSWPSSMVRILLLAGVLLACGCRSAPRKPPPPIRPMPPPTTRPLEVLSKPAIDLTRGGAGFPLDLKHVPESVQELVEALARAYTARLEGSPALDIRADGKNVRRLENLEINLSGSTVNKDYTPQPPPKDYRSAGTVRAERLRYVADPLHYFNYSASLLLEADNAELALAPGTDGNLSLLLTDCREGAMRLRIELDDLRSGLLAGARFRQTRAFAIKGVQLRLRSRDTRSLEAELVLQAAVLLLPASVRITGRVDVDDEFNVYFTHLSATGLDPSGALVASFVQGKLDKLNNRAAPLLRLPGNRIRVTDLRLALDDALTIHLRFAGKRK